MTTNYKFQKGDKVQVISECQSYGKVGVVDGVDYWNTYITVKLNGGLRRTYNKNSLILYNEQNNITSKGDNEMITGNYRVAMVKFVQGTNTDKKYAFAVFEDCISVDEYVLCDTVHGYSVGKVIEIINKDEYNGVEITKEIVCPVCFDCYEQRKKNREEAKKLKSEMDKKMKEMQELALYEMMAEKSPELKEMLEQYKTLMN
jgi:hypothetical protein